MALFTDQNITTIADLRKYENAVLDLAASEGIDLDTKLSIAHMEVGLSLSVFLRTQMEGLSRLDDPLSGVVVNDSLRHWSVLHALAVLYRDLYSNQLNDRYLAKWRQYEKLADESRDGLFESGVGVVSAPIARATQPHVAIEFATGTPPMTYYSAVAWDGGSSGVGLTSEAVVTELEPGETMRIDPGAPVPHASGWNVYVGTSPYAMFQQNAQALSLGSSWLMSASGMSAGRTPMKGQAADYFVRRNRVLQRG
jgi:hypothetical protein